MSCIQSWTAPGNSPLGCMLAPRVALQFVSYRPVVFGEADLTAGGGNVSQIALADHHAARTCRRPQIRARRGYCISRRAVPGSTILSQLLPKRSNDAQPQLTSASAITATHEADNRAPKAEGRCHEEEHRRPVEQCVHLRGKKAWERGISTSRYGQAVSEAKSYRLRRCSVWRLRRFAPIQGSYICQRKMRTPTLIDHGRRLAIRTATQL